MTQRRNRFQWSLARLCAETRTTPDELNHWAALGLYGPGWTDPVGNSQWRHISRLVAHRTIIMKELVDRGMTETAALAAAGAHETRDRHRALLVSIKRAQYIEPFALDRGKLDLP